MTRRSTDLFRSAGHGVSDPSRRARCRRWSNGPTASPRCSTTRSREAVFSRSTPHSRLRRCSLQHIRPARPHSSCWRATPGGTRRVARGEPRCPARHVGHRSSPSTRSTRTCLGTRRSGQPGPENAWRRAQGPRLMCHRDRMDARAVLPTIRVPTLVLHHTDDRDPGREGQVHRRAHTRAQNTLSCRAATCTTS